MTKFENNLSPYLTIVEATEPSAPAAGQQRLYIDSTTHLLKATNSSGTDRTIEGGGLADQGVVTYFDFTTASAPSSPAAGKIRVYSKTGDHLTQKDSSGTETALDSAGGGSSALTLLSTTTLGSDTSSITVTGISGSYKDLIVVCKLRGTASANGVDSWVRLGNSSADSGSNYSDQASYSGSASGTVASDSATKVYLGQATAASATAGLFSSVRFEVLDYAATSVYRWVTGAGMAVYSTSRILTQINGMWKNVSAAVDVVSVFPDSANFLTGSRVYIYGRG